MNHCRVCESPINSEEAKRCRECANSLTKELLEKHVDDWREWEIDFKNPIIEADGSLTYNFHRICQ